MFKQRPLNTLLVVMSIAAAVGIGACDAAEEEPADLTATLGSTEPADPAATPGSTEPADPAATPGSTEPADPTTTPSTAPVEESPVAAPPGQPGPSFVHEPEGTLRVGVINVGPRVYSNYTLEWPYNDRNTTLGIYENLTTYWDLEVGPMIAESWELTEEGVTFTIREDVPWHDPEYGNVTTEDVLFSYEEARREGTLYTAGADINRMYEGFDSPDSRTIVMPFRETDFRWATPHRLTSVSIQSKKLHDEIGSDAFNRTPMGTGPFKVVEHVVDDVLVLEAVNPHYRVTPRVERIEVLEVPEEATRLAMLQTGELDITLIGLPNIDQAAQTPDVKLVEGKVGGLTGANVYFAGLLYSEVADVDDQTPLDRTLQTNLPWVGDPDDEASMESAYKVRMAMNMAIDREAINDALLGGRGCRGGIYPIDPCHERFEERWLIPYDPSGAGELLAEAGYPDGFSFTFFIPTGVDTTREEIGEALVPMWEAIGLDVNIQKVDYNSRRPEMLERTIADPWIFGHGGVEEAESWPDRMNFLTSRRVWNPGIEYDEAREFEDRLSSILDEEEQWEVITEFQDWIYQTLPDVQVVDYRLPWVAGPRVEEWPLHHHPATWPRELEYIEVAN